jgi:hypothetical protein
MVLLLYNDGGIRFCSSPGLVLGFGCRKPSSAYRVRLTQQEQNDRRGRCQH